MALYLKKSPQNSDIDFFDESKGEALIVKRYISRNAKKPSRLKRFQSKNDSKASNVYDTGINFFTEKKEGPKCLNCGGVDHFSRECKSKRIGTNEDNEAKYKNVLASLKRQNVDGRS